MAKRRSVRHYELHRHPAFALVITPPQGAVLPLYSRECPRAEGFSWGYGGEAPAQLAYCLLRHHSRSAELARLCSLTLRRDVTAKVRLGHWRLHPAFIDRWIAYQAMRRDPPAPIWVSTGAGAFIEFIAGAEEGVRAIIRAMVELRDRDPLCDYLADLGFIDDRIILAEELLNGLAEGDVLA